MQRIGTALADTRLKELLISTSFKLRADSAGEAGSVDVHRLLERERRRAAAAERRNKELCQDNQRLEKFMQEARNRERQAAVLLTQKELELAQLQCELDNVRKSNRRRAHALDGVTVWLSDQCDGGVLHRLVHRREEAGSSRHAIAGHSAASLRPRMHA